MTEHNPDSWVVIKMTYRDKAYYKVLGGWNGKVPNGNTWRLLSHVTKAEYDVGHDVWYFYGHHNTVYIVAPDTYGLRKSTEEIWNTMKNTHPNAVELLENQDWSVFNFGE